jgi:phage-related protein
MSPKDKPLVWLHGEIRTPPFAEEARIEAGFLLRRLQQGEQLSLPQARPMPTIGKRCHELRIRDRDHVWRIIYRIDGDAIVVLEVFAKASGGTPEDVKETCRQRLKRYDAAQAST